LRIIAVFVICSLNFLRLLRWRQTQTKKKQNICNQNHYFFTMTDVENIPSANADTVCKYSTDGWTPAGNSGWSYYNYKAYKSVNGIFSMYSLNALFSVLSMNSFWSLVCLNAFFSILACNSFGSVLSVNSAFSILSNNSFMSIGCNSGSFKICFGNDDN